VKTSDIFKWNSFQNLIKRLEHFLTEGGIFLLTGSIGGGKTTALRVFSGSLNPNIYRAVYMSDIIDSKKDFYASMLSHLGVLPLHYTGDSRRALRRHIEELARVKRIAPIFILDEAQNLPPFILEEVRLLLNSEYDSRTLAHFILSGHKLLRDRLSLHENEALRQRVTLKFHIHGFSLEETLAYISHRLLSAGGTAQIFSDSVLAKVHEESQGIPRMINKICSTLLLAACASEKKIIDELIFNQVKNEWQ
jgi:type II secretory pathway predicted ATPase ExeA